ncbi:MAG: PQQ-binding-like beta-propeller repeat protein [Verrucomicrobia bacterium]|nr:PQQ-binding-like beta-propeller repeat protein [Verrucomicrobiota bacterium]
MPIARDTLLKPVRWWPAALIGALASAAIVYFRFIRELPSQQHRNMATMTAVVIAALLLFVWAMLFSRLRWEIRGLVFVAVIGAMGMIAGLFEIYGVTGDLVPLVKLRWTRSTVHAGTEARLPITSRIVTRPGDDWPQFLGPNRDSTLPDGPKLARDWNARPPQQLWRHPVGPAWSGFAIAGNRAITMEQQGEEEWTVCYELLTGKVLWTHTDTARFATTIAGEGPRTTATITGNKVLTLGGTGILNCLDLATGKPQWSKNVLADNQSGVNEWGTAGSPLVRDGLVVVNPGGNNGRSLVAYRLDSGERAWRGGDDHSSYSSPCAATLCGLPQILIFNHHAVFGHDAATGRELWKHLWNPTHAHVTQPIAIAGDRVLVSSGYGEGSVLLRIQNDNSGNVRATPLWKTRRLKSKFNNMVTRDGFVYGLDDGTLACVELATGELKWREGRYGHGQFILVHNLLILTAEDGSVVLLDPQPTGRRELTRFRALTGKTWNPPALAGDLLLMRNADEAACYRLPTE